MFRAGPSHGRGGPPRCCLLPLSPEGSSPRPAARYLACCRRLSTRAGSERSSLPAGTALGGSPPKVVIAGGQRRRRRRRAAASRGKLCVDSGPPSDERTIVVFAVYFQHPAAPAPPRLGSCWWSGRRPAPCWGDGCNLRGAASTPDKPMAREWMSGAAGRAAASAGGTAFSCLAGKARASRFGGSLLAKDCGMCHRGLCRATKQAVGHESDAG